MKKSSCRDGFAGWLVAAVILLPAGCGRPGAAPTAPVGGTLSAAGTPIAGVNVTFTPADGRSATGITDAEGRFTLSTFATGDGAVPGRHRVTLSVSTADVPMPGTPEAASYKPQPAPFAKKYGGLDSTDLEVDIPAAGDRAIMLDVESR
ncbi:MAG: carboxypeptidase-like regulatory domain-containing protein [Planctomycetota bacterium]|nr:carboxypeptidase-like regulatory domain-containing protein [Planctomycetota bacterium]